MTPRPRREQVQANERKCTRGNNSYRCRVCRNVHNLKKCVRFLRLSMEKWLRPVLVNGYCANCLAHEHLGESCRSGNKCRQCDGDHHTLLHMRESTPSPRSRSRSPSTRSSSLELTGSELAGALETITLTTQRACYQDERRLLKKKQHLPLSRSIRFQVLQRTISDFSVSIQSFGSLTSSIYTQNILTRREPDRHKSNTS